MIKSFLIDPNRIFLELENMKEDRHEIKAEKTLFRDINRYLMNAMVSV